MLNCHGLFCAEEIWFLNDTIDFKNRRLEAGYCPFCGNWIVGLFEKDKKDNKRYFYRAKDKKAKRLYEECKTQIDYKKSDIPKGTKSNMGFIFGVNELVCVNGEKVILQKAVDFNGKSRTIKKLNEF